VGLKDRLRRLQREAEGDGVLVRLSDGSAKVFDAMEIYKAMFLAKTDLIRGTARDCEVLDAVRRATPESRRAFEERFGSITMTAHIIAAQYQGAWVETHTLLEDGTVKKLFYEGGSEEAERIRQEVSHGDPAF
jgi:hypothetical protein